MENLKDALRAMIEQNEAQTKFIADQAEHINCVTEICRATTKSMSEMFDKLNAAKEKIQRLEKEAEERNEKIRELTADLKQGSQIVRSEIWKQGDAVVDTHEEYRLD